MFLCREVSCRELSFFVPILDLLIGTLIISGKELFWRDTVLSKTKIKEKLFCCVEVAVGGGGVPSATIT